VSAARTAASSGKLSGDPVGLAGVAAAEAADCAVEPADLVLVRVGPEQSTVEVGGDRDDAAADRDARLAGVVCFRPRLAEQLDLLRLKLVERHLRVLEQERGAHQVQALLACPHGGLA
jgi:hypothetical protein